jgi:branched-chain amino acid transport system substrate-binding protein
VVQEGDILTNKILGVALSEHGDAYAKDCKL